MKKIQIVLLSLMALSACGQESSSNKMDYTDKTVQTVYLKSKVSDHELPISLPNCLIEGISVLPGKQQDKTLASSMTMRVERLAFSYPEFPAHLECSTVQDSKGADIYAANPLGKQEEQLLKVDPFAYFLHTSKAVGASFVASKNNMDLYKVAPYRDAVFVSKNFLGNSRPLSIDFIRFDSNKNDSFRYYFGIKTILKGEYLLRYEVIATAKDPTQFAEKLRNIIEEDKNVLDYPDVIAEFVANNEKIADFFENQQTGK